MTIGVMKPKPKESGLGQIANIAQIGAGAATGNPMLIASGGLGLAQSQQGQGSQGIQNTGGAAAMLRRKEMLDYRSPVMD